MRHYGELSNSFQHTNVTRICESYAFPDHFINEKWVNNYTSITSKKINYAVANKFGTPRQQAYRAKAIRARLQKSMHPKPEQRVKQITPTNSLPRGEVRVVWFWTPISGGELMGAISLLFRPPTLSAGVIISSLFSPAFDRAFDHLQLIRTTWIFKIQ